LTDTVIEPADKPVVSSVTSAPVVDESVPPVVDQVKLGPSAPVAVALNVTRSPTLTEEELARISQVTVGHGGSVISKLVVHVVCPVVTQSLGQSTAGTVAVTVVVTEYLPQARLPVGTSTVAAVPLTVTGRPCASVTCHLYS
jgi:hypothetical protein